MKRYYTPNKHVINENHLLRMKYNDLIQYILFLHHEIDRLTKLCHHHNENEYNHNNYNNKQNQSNAILTLQNKNAMLNKTIIEKNKQLSSLMMKFDVPKSYNGLDCSYNFSYSETSSDSGINE